MRQQILQHAVDQISMILNKNISHYGRPRAALSISDVQKLRSITPAI
jgi:hypothetical protein